MQRSRSGKRDNTKVNLTPMLDVVFIMLIFFIVTATFVKEVGLDVNRPEGDPPPVSADKKSIMVRVTSRDRIIIAQREVDVLAVRANIERMHAENPEAPVIVLPHPESSTGTTVRIIDSAKLAGVPDVKLGQVP